jgi:hypothetical protein
VRLKGSRDEMWRFCCLRRHLGPPSLPPTPPLPPVYGVKGRGEGEGLGGRGSSRPLPSKPELGANLRKAVLSKRCISL